MSDEGMLNTGELTTSQPIPTPKLYDDNQVNDLLRYKLERQESKLRQHYEEEVNRLKSTLPNEEAIANRVQSELETRHKKALQDQEQATFQMQFARDKNQYQNHVKDLKLPEEDDECGLFTPEGEKKYLPLQIAAGNLNMEDTAEIMKELARNPHKLIQANTAAKDGDWTAVKAMFKKISGSIKNNKSALDARSNAAEPLSHLKASSGGSSNREMNLSDFKRDRSLLG